jgi:hypothetical protein
MHISYLYVFILITSSAPHPCPVTGAPPGTDVMAIAAASAPEMNFTNKPM